MAVTIGLTGCTTHEVTNFGSFDRSERTAAIAPGTHGILGVLKDALTKAGWKLSVVYRLDGRSGNRTNALADLQGSRDRGPRYLILVYQHVVDVCLTAEDFVAYEIIFIDVKSGAEVRSIKGRKCLSAAAHEIGKSISVF
ncbi:MAG: hypothetical protein ACREC6_09760 [Hyphomicrobiaceae bacterium]